MSGKAIDAQQPEEKVDIALRLEIEMGEPYMKKSDRVPPRRVRNSRETPFAEDSRLLLTVMRWVMPLCFSFLALASVAAQSTAFQIASSTTNNIVVGFDRATNSNHGWNLKFVRANGSTTGEIPIQNLGANEPLWRLEIYDSNGSDFIIDPVSLAALSGVTITTLGFNLTASIAYMQWDYNFSTAFQGITHVTVEIFAGLPDSSTSGYQMLTNDSLWSANVTVTSTAGSEKGIERLEFPRVAVGSAASGSATLDGLDKMYVPHVEGVLATNYTSSSFAVNSGNDIWDFPHYQSHQQYGFYRSAVVNQSPYSLTVAQSVASSQALLIGSRDTAGWSKSVRINPIGKGTFGGTTSSPYMLWTGNNWPKNNRTAPVASGGVATSAFQTTSGPMSTGFFWAIGALPAKSDWYDIAKYYRNWSTQASWELTSTPYQLQKVAQDTNFSSKVKASTVMLTNSAPKNATTGLGDWTNAIVPDVQAWKQFMSPLSLGSAANDIVVLSYGHVIESGIDEQGLDKYIDIYNPFASLTPRSYTAYQAEATGVSAISGVSMAMYSYAEGVDRQTPYWAGSGASAVSLSDNPPDLPTIYGAVPPSSPVPPILPSTTSFAPFGDLRYSYQVLYDPTFLTNNGYGIAAPKGVVSCCPDSTVEFGLAFPATLGSYYLLMKAQTGLASSPISGFYLDAMISPGTPLCYYSPDTHPSDSTTRPSAHLHQDTGGGRWWTSAKRGLAGSLRDFSRLYGSIYYSDTTFYDLTESPSEYWIGAAEMMGSEIHSAANAVVPTTSAVLGNYTYSQSTPIPSAPSSSDNISVSVIPSFDAIYGDYCYRYQWGLPSPDMGMIDPTTWPHGTALNPTAPATAFTNVNPPSSTTPMPGSPYYGFTAGGSFYNWFCAYDMEAAGINPLSTMPTNSLISIPNQFWYPEPTTDAALSDVGVVGATTHWKNLLWNTAFCMYLPWTIDFHLKHQVTAFHHRGSTPFFPQYTTLEGTGTTSTSTSNPLVNVKIENTQPFRQIKRLLKAKDEWRDWYITGEMLAQPVIEPSSTTSHYSDATAMIARVTPDMRSLTFCSSHAHKTTSQSSIIVVTNWLPWSASFDVHFDPTRSGFPSTVTPNIHEFQPDVPGDSATYTIGTSGLAISSTSSSITGRIKFTTSTIEPNGIRVYLLN